MRILISVFALTIFFAGYGLVHSWLASASTKAWTRRRFGPTTDRWYRLAYNIFAVVSLLPMLALMAFLPQQTLYVVPLPWRWLMVGGQFLALLGAAMALLQTDPFYFAGLSQLVSDPAAKTGALNVSGFYARMRHPLYTFSMLFLWLTPVISTNTLTTFVLFTLYFYVGSIYEERRLLAEFGAVYEAYQAQVPRFIPWPGRRAAAGLEEF